MMNALVKWQVGYYITIDFQFMQLQDACLHFYDKDGNVVTFRLDDGCQFWLDIQCDEFNIRKKHNFSRNEVFAIKHKKYSEDYYSVYIPMDAVDLTHLGKKTAKCSDGYHIEHYNEYALKVSEYGWWSGEKPNHENLKHTNDAVIFKENISITPTKKQKFVDNLSDEIYETCGISISDYGLKKMLKYYDIVKK